MKKKTIISLTTTQIILLSFLLVILVGSVLLSLPFATKSGEAVPYIDALFTATTSVCVTGLVTLPTVSTWSLFGQIVILLLIQVGGLGVITVMSGIMIMVNKKMKFRDSLLIKDAFNLNTMSDLAAFVKKVIKGTMIIEGIGALLYMTVFIPQFGLKGIWISVFNSISAFCNAGIDIIAQDSLCSYMLNPVINTVTSLLIILGGLGYIVWWDLIRVAKNFKREGIRCLRKLTLHSKIVLVTTIILILGGAAIIFILEYSNLSTIGGLSLGGKIGVSLFQSVTTRTAGFATIPQENLTNACAIVCMVLMFIGGSPVGTAGGIKTVTVAVLIVTAYATITGKDEISLFNRRLSKQTTRKAVGVFGMSFVIMLISTVLLSAFTPDASVLDIMYETVSATATVGLTRALTPLLNMAGKIIIIITMYLGRIGPISLAIAFSINKEKTNSVKNPTEEISVG